MKIFINDKTYDDKAERLVKSLEKVDKNISICLQPTDLSIKTKLQVWSQHVDPITKGSHTGWLLPETIKKYAYGTLINHSEHPVDFKTMKKIVERCNEVKLKTMILVPKVSMIKKVKKLNPDFIGFEPPELIGSKTNSVSSLPNLIEKAVKLSNPIPLFIGAGVKSKKDLETGRKLGAKGVLIASAVVKAKDPAKVVKSLI